MSLIADALKAAQGEKNRGSAASGGSRRVIAASVLRRGAAPARSAGSGFQVPRSLGLATAVFAVALLVSASVIALAPTRGTPIDGSAAAATPTLRAERPPAEPAASAEPATVASAAVDAAPPALDALSVAGPAGGVQAHVGGPAAVPAAEVAEMAASAPAPAAAERDPARAGRFEIVVEPAAPAADPLAEAIVAHRRGDHAAAIVLYQRALAQNPRNGQALNNLGSAYQASGQLALARDAFRRAIALDERDGAAWSSLGVVLGALGEPTEAQAALGEAVRLDAGNHGAKVNLANHFLARGLTADARRLLDEVVRQQPGHAEAHYALGRVSEQQGDRASATRHYRAFLDNARGRFPQLEGPVRSRIAQLGEG